MAETEAAAAAANSEVQKTEESATPEAQENGHEQTKTDSTEPQTKESSEEKQSGSASDDASKENKEPATAAAASEETPAVTPELKKKIISQIEYYFGDYNLPRDKFLSAEIKNDDGWVSLDTMVKFARLAKLSSNKAVIAEAVAEATESIMEINEEQSKIRRRTSHPLPELNEGLQEDAIKRTIYCKGFPKDGSITLDVLLEYFKQFGEYDSVRMRTYVDQSSARGFKGSVLVVFKTTELAKTFLESPPVQYKKTYLIRKWFADYLEEKKSEVEERRARKQARLEGNAGKEEGKAEFEELPRGNFLRATGFTDKTSREDIKSAVLDLTSDCAFVSFNKGDTQAYIRFSRAGCNKQVLAALKDNLTVKGANIELFLVEGEEEEEQLKKANEARRKAHAAGPQQKKRKMGGGGFRGRNKRQRTK